MLTFNLLHEPWIPVQIGDRPAEVGLREALHRAGDIEGVEDASPLVTIALHRLLLALFHRVYGPASTDDWAALWRADRLDSAPLDAYLDRWSNRFDLFGADHPFYQTTNTRGAGDVSVAILAHELGGTNGPYFSHVPEELPLSPAEAARYLLAYQAFARPGLHTPVPGESNTSSAEAGLLSFSAVCLVRGETLRETLLLNAVLYDGKDHPFAGQRDDTPVWEREAPHGREVRLPFGYLDWLTWQSRSIRLLPDADGRVRRSVVLKGVQLPKDVSAHEYETMVAYRPVEKPAGQPDKPIGFMPERAVWRDSLALFEETTRARCQPRTLRALAATGRQRALGKRRHFPLDVFGVHFIKGQGSVGLWRHERLPLPLAYLTDSDLHERLDQAIDVTERTAKALKTATWLLAREVLAPQYENREPDRKAVDALVQQLAPERRYWPQLEPHFAAFLTSQAQDWVQKDGQRVPGRTALGAWTDVVCRAAEVSLAGCAGQIGSSGRAVQAMVPAQRVLGRTVHQVRQEKEKEDAA
ncbi:MAG TPA: type I-E CRISPR-associated protein Cse1/CasA [Chloroflexota bacterium]|nr:type I-E CRISPR-associated protein Cse1/CasA [Chloroflexota bacterium]